VVKSKSTPRHRSKCSNDPLVKKPHGGRGEEQGKLTDKRDSHQCPRTEEREDGGSLKGSRRKHLGATHDKKNIEREKEVVEKEEGAYPPRSP